MELRLLEYFVAVARERSISGAAEALHITQPTLSRQIRELEQQLGCSLIIRGSRSITLTNEGVLLRKRAEEILDLVKKTEGEIALSERNVAGNIFIGAGELDAVRVVMKAAKQMQADYPDVRFHFVSGDYADLIDRLDSGLFDFALLVGDVDGSKYNSIPIPCSDEFGLLMRRDDPLTSKEYIRPDDLKNIPLIHSRQALKRNYAFERWLGSPVDELNIVATYNLVYNAGLMVREGMGYVIALNKLINTTGDSELCFRYFDPPVRIEMSIVWKKYRMFSRPAELFFEYFGKISENYV